MDKFKNYSIAFPGLKLGKHEFKFEVNQEFINLFDFEQEFFNPNINVDVLLDKHSTFLEFWITISGTIQLICDISSEEFPHPIEHQMKILVKFGEEYDDSNEEVITIPQHNSDFNISQLIYEGIVLSVPMKKVSPSLEENDEYQQLLEKYSPKDVELNEETEDEEIVDPRWEALKKLKNNN